MTTTNSPMRSGVECVDRGIGFVEAPAGTGATEIREFAFCDRHGTTSGLTG